MASLSPRPTTEQMLTLVNFMEKHRSLGFGKMRGHGQKYEVERLWKQLTKNLNSMSGQTRTVKSWMKFWSDKKSSVRAKIAKGGGASSLSSSIEVKIYGILKKKKNMILSEKSTSKVVKKKRRKRCPKEEYELSEEEDIKMEDSDLDPLDVVDIDSREMTQFEERQLMIMENILKALDRQATALSHVARVAQLNAEAMERLSQATQIQSQAVLNLSASLAGGAAPRDPGAGLDMEALALEPFALQHYHKPDKNT